MGDRLGSGHLARRRSEPTSAAGHKVGITYTHRIVNGALREGRLLALAAPSEQLRSDVEAGS